MKKNDKYFIVLIMVFSLILVSVIGSIVYINLAKQNEEETKLLKENSEEAVLGFAKSHSLLKELEEYITYDKLNDTDGLSSYFSNLTKNNENVLKISIFTPNENGLLTVNASSDPKSIQTNASKWNYEPYETGHTFYIINKNEPVLTIVSPVNITGNIIGTQEMVLTMYQQAPSHEEQIRFMIIALIIALAILIISFLIILKLAITKYQKN